VSRGRTDRDGPEVIESLRRIAGWDIVELDGIKRLRRVCAVDDFAQALEFTRKVGELAEDEGHHPALLSEWGAATS
jgi:4a-hydroxytetrahydrobiopterin dehydratase